MSLAQECWWNTHEQVDHTDVPQPAIAVHLDGEIDNIRLSRVVGTVMRRHEVFRTRFLNADAGTVQDVMSMPSPSVQLQAVSVADHREALAGFSQLEKHDYALGDGDTVKLLTFQWSPSHQLLAFGCSRYVGDVYSLESVIREISQLYAGNALSPPGQQYLDFATQQRQDYENGLMADDIAFWERLHKPTVNPLPTGDIHSVQARNADLTADDITSAPHRFSIQIDPMVAIRVKERSRKHKASAHNFYLTAFHVLLARLTRTTDIAVGVVDANRDSPENEAMMGPCENILPLRMAYSTLDTFGDELVAVRDHMQTALKHSRVPYGVLLQHLSGKSTQSQSAAPLFQAVFDYRADRPLESSSLGSAKIVDVQTSYHRAPCSVALELSQNSDKTIIVTFKLRGSQYGAEDAERMANAYLSILSVFSRNPALKVNEGHLDLSGQTAL